MEATEIVVYMQSGMIYNQVLDTEDEIGAIIDEIRIDGLKVKNVDGNTEIHFGILKVEIMTKSVSPYLN